MDIKVFDKIEALTKELNALRERQAQASKVVQDCSALIQQHIGAIAVLKDMFPDGVEVKKP